MPKKRVRKRRTAVATKAYVDRKIRRSGDAKFVQASLTSSFSTVSTTWSEKDMTDIDEGLDTTGRDGRDITVTGFELYGVCQVGDATNILRIQLALWDATSSTPCQTNTLTMDQKPLKMGPTSKGLIKVYHNKYYAMVVSQDSELKVIKIKKNFKKGIKINYTSSDGETAQRKLILSMISDSAGVPNPGFTHGHVIIYFRE